MNSIKIKVPYVSVWDGGVELQTQAFLHIKTGEITDIETTNTHNSVQVCEREYIILGDEQIDVLSENGSYWIQLSTAHPVPCTANYMDHQQAIAFLSITQIIRITDYLIELSQFVDENNEILDDMEAILQPFHNIITKLRCTEICRHGECGSYLYKSDLPQYDFVCPNCEENF